MKKEIIVGAVMNARDKLDNPKFFIRRDDLLFCMAARVCKEERLWWRSRRVMCSQGLPHPAGTCLNTTKAFIKMSGDA